MADTTRGGLVPAKLSDGSTTVNFMFNPEYYSIKQEIKWERKENTQGQDVEEFKTITNPTLSIPALLFDTYEEGTAVTDKTQGLIDLMQPKYEDEANKEKPVPREVTFTWGTFEFKAYIDSVEQKFTLFKQDGTPVRAEVTVGLKQLAEILPNQNPSSGGGPTERIWRVEAGDRIDVIAARMYGDATKWRLIAEHNSIEDPFHLRPGLELGIPAVN